MKIIVTIEINEVYIKKTKFKGKVYDFYVTKSSVIDNTDCF